MSDEIEQSGIPGSPPGLDELDPGREDVWYWSRFQERVMAQALPELLRRDRAARVTLAHVMESWSRLLVPGTVAAAVLGAVLFLSQPEPAPINDSPVLLDELTFPADGDQEGLPDFLASDDVLDRDAVLFAVEGY